MIERCGDRQRKCDGLEKWPLHLFVESLPMMMQVALLLLACGLCRHMWSINASVAYTLIGFTGLGVLFYIAISVAATSSYACPFQTPASIALRSGIDSLIVYSKRVLSRIHRMWNRRVRPFLRRQSLQNIPLESVQVRRSEPWLKPKDLAVIHRTNTDDVRCVSWFLRNITDPEALDAAIRLAGIIRWFDDGINVDPPFDLIVSTFEACFDSTRRLYPGLKDRAYHSGRAMIWIHTLAMCESKEFARMFPLPTIEYTGPAADPDLRHLLWVNLASSAHPLPVWLLDIYPGHTSSHLQWISNLLLHRSWANRTTLHFHFILGCISSTEETAIPLDVTLNRLLVWCAFLGLPFEEEAQKVQDKSCATFFLPFRLLTSLFASDRMERVLHQLSKAIISAIGGTYAQHRSIPYVLGDLIKLENRPVLLTQMAYEWCSVICKNQRGLEDWENLLLISLEIGFRHLDIQDPHITLTHTEHHRELVDVIFKSQESEAIGDLLYAWARNQSPEPAHELLGLCTGHLVDLHNLGPFSSRLRRIIIRSIGLLGYKGFEEVGLDKLIELLNHLHVTVEDMDQRLSWGLLLLSFLELPEGVRRLSNWYWDSLLELATSIKWLLKGAVSYNPWIMRYLAEAQEWSKLECWIATVWVLWPPETDGITEEDLERSMMMLFRQRPGAVRRLEEWMEQWSQTCGIPASFQRICKQAYEAAQQDVP